MNPRYIIFSCHGIQLDWYVAMAPILRRRVGWRSMAWVAGRRDFLRAQSSGAFDEVVDVIQGFDRFAPEVEARHSANLAGLREYELRFGDLHFHEDASLDRCLGGIGDVTVNSLHFRNRWRPAQIAAVALHMLRRMDASLADKEVLLALGEHNSLRYRLACWLLQSNGAPYICPYTVSHAQGRFFFDSVDNAWPACEQAYARCLQGLVSSESLRLAEQRWHQIVVEKAKPSYFAQGSRGAPALKERLQWRRLLAHLREWREARSPERLSDPGAPAPEIHSPAAYLARYGSGRRRRRYYEHLVCRRLPSQKYAAYFLHSQPEYTIDGLAFEYRDQVAFVRNVVANLPADVLLLVKEHRAEAGRRSEWFYGELVSIPNVILVHDLINAADIIRQAALTVTLTGTVALESVCFGVPCVVFGKTNYSIFRGVYKVRGFAHFRELTRQLDQLRPATREEAVAALAARLEVSYPGNFLPTTPEDIRMLTEGLIQECRRRGMPVEESPQPALPEAESPMQFGQAHVTVRDLQMRAGAGSNQ